MTELERLGTQLDAIETALEVAQREPSGPRRQRLLSSVQRATGAVRREHRRRLADAPNLRLITKGKLKTDVTDGASEKRERKKFVGVAVTATALVTACVTLAMLPEADSNDALPSPKPYPSAASPLAPPVGTSSSAPGWVPSVNTAPPRTATPPTASAIAGEPPSGPVPHADDVALQLLSAPAPMATSTPVASPAPASTPASASPSAPATPATSTPGTPATTSATPARACLRVHRRLVAASVCPRDTAGQSHAAG